MAPTSGILYVTMGPKPGLSPTQFHDWYNNEHGPGRLRLPFIQNGFRYRANDLLIAGEGAPEWMAIYDVTDMSEMTKEPYIGLRKAPIQSQRERDTMKQITVDRKFYDFVRSWEADNFKKLEDVSAEGEKNVLIAVITTLNDEKDRDEMEKWYVEEHIPMLSKVPGWLRSRRFITSTVEPRDTTEYLTLHEYAPENGLEGEEFKVATSTPWQKEIMEKIIREKRRRVYDLVYTFGPAPRNLSNLSEPFVSTDGRTRTFPATSSSSGAIESFITTRDGAILPYRLEGSTDPDAPLIILTNSILVSYGIWDNFLKSFFSVPENQKYRVVRYLTRGRTSQYGTQPITLDVLASDLITILDALRVKKAAAAIGVSLGGATVLNAALKYPNRIAAFVSCDTNANSPAGNSKAWGERIAIAEKEAAIMAGENVVGEELAEVTVRRWFVKETYDGGALEQEAERVKEMVKSNSLEGFKKSVEALFSYDVRDEMKTYAGKGMFLVGSGDGVLPGTMKTMAETLGSGAAYTVIDGAGHLPMVEKPEEFSAAITKFLAYST
jgi:pimeloyl-ACP methyl ester carboxylesterase